MKAVTFGGRLITPNYQKTEQSLNVNYGGGEVKVY